MMKPLGGIGGGLGLDAPQKVSTSTAATGGSCAEPNQDGGKPGFLFGSYQGFGAMMNSNTNAGQEKMVIGEVVLRQANYIE